MEVCKSSMLIIEMFFPILTLYSFPFPRSIIIISPCVVAAIIMSFPFGVFHHKQQLTPAPFTLTCLSIIVISETFVKVVFLIVIVRVVVVGRRIVGEDGFVGEDGVPGVFVLGRGVMVMRRLLVVG